MSDEDRQSRTEDATETKLREAVERGDLPVSREAAHFAGLLAMLAAATLLLPRAAGDLATALAALLDGGGVIRIKDGEDAARLLHALGGLSARALGPIVLALMAAGMAAYALQNPIRLSAGRLAPKWSRLAPGPALGRMLGAKGAVEFGKSLAKVLGLGLITVFVLRADAPALLDAAHLDPARLPAAVLLVAAHLLAACAVAMALAAGADLVLARRRWRADLRMTPHEVKEERRQAEGDPLVKARLRSIALDRARRRMIGNVPRATVVIANPTHFAVALRYKREEGGAPLVVAKGQDLLALRIRERAAEHGIPVIEDKPLARALYDQVEVERMIPAQFYRAVAEILNMLARRGAGGGRDGL